MGIFMEGVLGIFTGTGPVYLKIIVELDKRTEHRVGFQI